MASASSRRISDSFFCTCSAKTYCAGRCLERSISGAIGPDVLMPRNATQANLNGLLSAAVAALFILAGAVGIPVGGLHQLVEGLRIAFAEQIARLLPAEDVARRHAPRRALVFLVAREEVQEQAGVDETP